MSLLVKVQKEITELHDFFENYFKGNLDKDSITRFTNVLDNNFQLITPTAIIFDRDTIISVIEQSYDTRIAIKIWIEDITMTIISDEIVRASYFELQQSNGNQPNKRISSVFFKIDTSKKNNLLWLHVHETFVIEN